MDIKRNLINIYNNNVLIDTFVVDDLTTANQIAQACKITLTEAQTLLNGRQTLDINNFCCDSPLATINSITAGGNYNNPGSITLTVDITNADTTIYNIIVKEGLIILLNYTGSNVTNIIPNLTFVSRVKRIFDVDVTTTTCSGNTNLKQTFALGPEGLTYGMGNGLLSGVTNMGQMYKNGSVGGQLIVNNGDSVQIQYFIGSWFNETKIANTVTNSGIAFNLNTPFNGIPLSNQTGVPTYGRFRNLTLGSAWEDFGQQIPVSYP